ncbi:hypothetical protein C0J08_06470 [Marinomonas sp. CT5]|uniref:hypothetical protein n=1 Tax=Marinomonas sp. CT5 TaxID=2066133 RepID=UPI001BB0C4E4|nr:hypothetical protein [Marinomonas sp. CT5]QUX95082.1 hypothetical protein C0J08_06470 [Marinomonas sp. CT5]
MESIKLILAFWNYRFMSSREVIAWADEEIKAVDEPDDDLITLSLEGPEVCTKLPSDEFPRSTKLPYEKIFAIKASIFDLSLKEERDKFISWMLGSCRGLSLDIPEVRLAYDYEHISWDGDNPMKADEMFDNSFRNMLKHWNEQTEELEGRCLTNQSTTRILRRKQRSCSGY